MPSEPDVFKKLDALLNKHKQGESVAPAPKPSDEEPIPTLMDVIEDEEEVFPVLTDVVATTGDETVAEELELELEFIPEDIVDTPVEPVLSAELPDVWEENEHEFDAETTHGFGLSAFSRAASNNDDSDEEEEDDEPYDTEERVSESGDEEADELFAVGEDAAANNSADAGHAANSSGEDENADDNFQDDVSEPLFESTEQPALDAESFTASEADASEDVDSAETKPEPGHEETEHEHGPTAPPTATEIPVAASAPSQAEQSDISAREQLLNDALAERALRDLDRHVAAILERQVGPQLAHRLDQALASMLDQFSTNLESLVRDAVRDEMRRYFDGDDQ